MKKLTLTVALLAVAGTASATAQGVYTSDEGSRKIVFWYDSKDGTVVYNFNISDHTGRPATKNGILYQSSNPQKPVAGNAYTFAQNSSYYEEKDKSRCLISASWNKKGVLTLAAGNSKKPFTPAVLTIRRISCFRRSIVARGLQTAVKPSRVNGCVSAKPPLPNSKISVQPRLSVPTM